MKHIWMLAAAATLAACAGRGEDEMGAAPDRGDTTAVTTGADTTQWDTTATGGVGQTDESGMIPDTAGTTEQYPSTGTTTDTTMGQTGGYGTPSDTSMTGQDTGATGGYDTTASPGADSTTTTSVPGAEPNPESGVSDPGMSADTGTTGDSAHVDHSAGGWQGDSALVDHNVPTADSAQAGQ